MQTEVLEGMGAPEGKMVIPEGMGKTSRGAQERRQGNQVVGIPGGPHTLPVKSPLLSGSSFTVYFDITIITHLYGSFLSGNYRSASRVMCGGLSLQCGDCGCLKALSDAPDEEWGIGNCHVSLLQHTLFSPLLPEPDYSDLSRLPQKHEECHLSGTAELSALNV